MSRFGQCPKCRTGYELEDEHIGHALECECGVTLFAADVAGFNEIPVLCDQCDGEYVVDRDGAGQSVECECGAEITVPDVVFRMPVSRRGKSAADAIEEVLEEPLEESSKESQPNAEKPQLGKGERLVDCPDCAAEYVVTRDDVGVEAVCECSCVFAVRIDDQKQVVASKVSKPKVASSSTASTKAKESDSDTDDEKEASFKPRSKKRSPLVWFALGAGVFLLFSICFAIAHKTGMLAKEEPKQQKPNVIALTPLETVPAGDKLEPIAAVSPGIAPNAESLPNDMPVKQAVSATTPETDTGNDTAMSTSMGSEDLSMFAPPPKKPLPKPLPARPIVPIVAPESRARTFDIAIEDAFLDYEKAKELEAEATKSKNNKAYHEQLGKTIGSIQAALDFGTQTGAEPEQIEPLRFMLAYSMFRAGYLGEASVMGEAVARYGVKDSPQTKSGAMIAMAACQEANQTHWATPENVGELDQMHRVIKLIEKRWPKDPSLSLYYLNLAQLYDRFSAPMKAAAIYRLIPASSKHFATSQLAAGSALWGEYRTLAADTENPAANPKQLNQIREQARKFLATGVKKSIEKDDTPTTELLVAKLALARIELSEEKLPAAERWLTTEPMAVTKSMSIKAGVDGKAKVSPAFVRVIYQTIYSIRSQLKDADGANEALSEMASLLGPDNTDQLGKLFLNAARNYISQLSRKPVVTRKEFSELSKLIEPLKGQNSALTAANILWLGEEWSKLAPKAANEELRKRCFEKAAAAYELAMETEGFKQSNLQGAQLRLIELLRGSDQLDQAATLIGQVLKKSPNAFGLQIEAAESLQQASIDRGEPLTLVDAIDGPKGSPIWGWKKLVVTLHGVQYSGNASPTNLDRLNRAQYNLALCNWLVAKATADPGKKNQRMVALHKLMKQISSQITPDSQPWAGKFNELVADVNAAK